MDLILVCVYPFVLGVVTGLRSMTGIALVSWAARLRWLHLDGTPLAVLGYAATPYIFSVAAIGEFVADKLPRTPSRKAAGSFILRVVLGALCASALGYGSGVSPIVAGLVGALGAVVGTIGGYEFRTRLVKAMGGKDMPIALLEDVIAVAAGLLIVSRFS